jgi:RimJ/RimL family protein N-acetyltransferase
METSMEDKCLIDLVSLRPLTRENLDDFFLWASDPEVAKFMTWEAYTDKKDAFEFLVNIAETHPYFKAIVFDGKVVGSVTLSVGKGNNSFKAELGYVLSRKYWGKGITTAAVIKAVQEGFSQLNLSRIEAYVDPQNIASQRVLEKSGMKLEGHLKSYMLFKGQISDRYIYAITQ